MANKKNSKDGKLSPEEALGKRVDAMMDPKQPDPAPAAKTDEVPPLDIFKDAPTEVASVTTASSVPKDAKTAPEVSGDLLSQVDTKPAADSSPPPKPKTEEPKPDQPESLKKDEPTPDEPTGGPVDDKSTDLDDQATDQAVDDIASKEADTVLALQDARNRRDSKPAKKGWKQKLKRILKSKWTWLGLILLLIILLAVPVTRYKLIGLFVKEQVTVTVLDSKTATPVSSATVQLSGKSAKTAANGQAKLNVPPGGSKLVVSKQYYKTTSNSYSVKLSASATQVKLSATGRQVPLTVLNKITGKPLANADIRALNTTAKTDAHGRTVLVLPASLSNTAAAVSLKGYNTAKVKVQVTDQNVPANTFNLVPSGSIYFLSTDGGNTVVVKSKLDGSGRQTVLTASGQDSAASLAASSDWRYAAVKIRDGSSSTAALYLINTANNKVTKFDSNNAAFNLIGWSGHYFMYQAVSNTLPETQAGHEAIKSYDAEQQELNQLDQNQADNGAYQRFYNFYVMNDLLAYSTQWYGANLGTQNASIRGIQPDGQNKRDYQTFPSASLARVQMAAYQPQAVYYRTHSDATGQTAYYNFANGTVNNVNLDAAIFNKPYPAYFISPSNNRTFWTDPGGTGLYTGNASAGRPKPIDNSGALIARGWSSDNYVLATRGNQLYIMPADGSAKRPPLDLGQVYLPAGAFQNYAYSYGP